MRPSGPAADVRRLIGRTLVVGTDRWNRPPHATRPNASVRRCRQRVRMEDGSHDEWKTSWGFDELYVMKRVAESEHDAARRLARAACRGDATINLNVGQSALFDRQAVRRRGLGLLTSPRDAGL